MRERTDRRESYDGYDEQHEYDEQHGYGERHGYGEYRDQRAYENGYRGERRSPDRAAPARRRTSRTPIAIAAVLTLAAAGTIAVVESGVLKKKDPAPLSGGPLTTTPASSSATDSSGAAPTTPAQAQPGLSAAVGGERVGAFYTMVELGLAHPKDAPAGDAANVPALFTGTSAFHTYWSSGKPTAGATCGAKAPTLSLVETPRSVGAGTTVRVDLFEKGRLAAKAADVTVDGSGKIVSIRCVPAVLPDYPGTSFVVDTYGKAQIPTKQIKATTYAPPAQDAAAPPLDADFNTCAQFLPDTWVFYAPVATAAGSAWRFGYDQISYPQLMNLFVDPASGQAERVVCEGLPEIPAPDPAAAGKASPSNGGDPADVLVDRLMQAYARERSLVSAGAKPTQEMAPYFASDEAFQAAVAGSGKIPFLCTDKDPFDLTANGAGTVTGTTETVQAVVSGTPTDGNREDAPTIGKPVFSIDLTTMKITGLACH